MNELLKAIDGLLSFLPFNGKKTEIMAGVGMALNLVQVVFPHLLVITPIVQGVTGILTGAALVHGGVKAARASKTK